MKQNNTMFELSNTQVDIVTGGGVFSSGYNGGALGAGLGGTGGVVAATMAGANAARWGAMAGVGGAAIGFVVGIAIHFVSEHVSE